MCSLLLCDLCECCSIVSTRSPFLFMNYIACLYLEALIELHARGRGRDNKLAGIELDGRNSSIH